MIVILHNLVQLKALIFYHLEEYSSGGKVWSVAPQDTAYKALQLMSEKNWGLSWLLTQGDVVKQLIADQKFENEQLERYIHDEC